MPHGPKVERTAEGRCAASSARAALVFVLLLYYFNVGVAAIGRVSLSPLAFCDPDEISDDSFRHGKC
jgi:hypothetical protein